jgi:2-methylcitrate dehydratase PrpD
MGEGGGAPFVSLIPSGARRSVEAAALVNGVAAHVLDYDDVGLDGHSSAVLVPAILAQGEASGASGAEMLTAYVAGYEVWAELAAREPTPLHRKGWHPTSVRGAVAAAAACAKLRGLDDKGTATAMAVAASMAAGVVANFGTMTKSFQVGRAAQAGVIAARLAQAGLTASLDALEHPLGLLVALSPRARLSANVPSSPPRRSGTSSLKASTSSAIRFATRPTVRLTRRSAWSSVTTFPPIGSRAFACRQARRNSPCSATASRRPASRRNSACSSRWPRHSSRARSDSPN